MAKKGNKYKIGALAVASVTILILGLLSLGIMKYFQAKLLFMTATDSSVQGLKKGSNVKIKGVTIGSVKDIKIGLGGTIIYIFMELDFDSLVQQVQKKEDFQQVKTLEEDFAEEIKKDVDQGMRCQLQYEGITGDMYVDVSYFDTKQYPAQEIKLPPGCPAVYVPSVPTTSIGNILENTQAIVNKLNSINFQKISENFDVLLVTLNDFSTQIKQILNKEKVAEIEGSINYSLDKFNHTMTSLNTLIKSIQMQPDSVIWGKAGSKVVPSLNTGSGANQK